MVVKRSVYRGSWQRGIKLLLLLICFVLIEGFGASSTKRLPPPGMEVPGEIREELEQGLKELQRAVALALPEVPVDEDVRLREDAEIYEKAVRYALEHNEFYRTNEFAIARELIAEGKRRCAQIREKQADWVNATGLVVRGYRSRIDGSVQPYGLVVPKGYRPGEEKVYRLDIWLHGRDDTLTELKFIHERSTKPGEFTPEEAFVLHPYGRYCNAFKFAGEVDVLEALERVRELYPIDSQRVVLRGFSMGGAGVWHLGAHYSDRFVVAAPGAGFAETARYLKIGTVPWWERKLWGWYDATEYALNFYHLPVIAYSGELDKQKQAAEVMGEAMEEEGLSLVHLIGPKTEHKYEPETKKLLNSIVDTIARGGKKRFLEEVRLTTRTLRYPKMHWLTLLGLEKHWERADAWARLAPTNNKRVLVKVTNVTAFQLDFRGVDKRIEEVQINGELIRLAKATNEVVLRREGGVWKLARSPWAGEKQPGLQGPIDDAFMDGFVFVVPSGKGFHEESRRWIQKELDRAIFEWRAQFRGEVKVVKDTDLTTWEIENKNLVLWGDPESNEVIGKVMPQLPMQWNKEGITCGDKVMGATNHVLLMIYPNPMNGSKYVVLNSGFTFRGFGSNANQTPKLPDYAVVKIDEPEPFQTGIAEAGFFDEQWQVRKEQKD